MQTFLLEPGLARKAAGRGIEFIAELVGKTECGHASGWEHHRLARVRIAAQAAALVMNFKFTEATDENAVLGSHGSLYQVDELFNVILHFRAALTGLFINCLNKIGFGHRADTLTFQWFGSFVFAFSYEHTGKSFVF